ncbi:DNA topoisomerase 1 [Basidiobolus ranarum]|uniref:DNA topoisomerase I n=1 Tax=Basidiobolus ranarum TaxID=34480 RepID=A0ABR2VUW5_9FUNG
MSDSEDDVPLGYKAQRKLQVTSDYDSDDDVPLQKRSQVNTSVKKEASSATLPALSNGSNGVKRKPEVQKDSRKKIKTEDSSDDEPLVKRVSRVKSEPNSNKPSANAAKKRVSSVKDESDDDVPLAKKTAKTTVKKATPRVKKEATPSTPSGRGKKTNEETPSKDKGKVKEEEEEETYKWWEDSNQDNTIKWNTLQHNGVLFPPDYIPHGVKMKYEGKVIELLPEAEEVAGFFAALLGSDHGNNPTFQKNFFNDWTELIKKVYAEKNQTPPPIKEFSKCDFTPMFEHFQREKEAKKSMTKEEKAEIKAQKLLIDEKYGYAILDGRREKVGNFRIEPPGLFRGRGEHPKTGCLKQRVQPEQVTINIGKEAKLPEAPPGHQWGKIIHDNTVTWLAMWKENVNDNIKYVFLAAGSSLKGQSDLKKFEKARNLKKLVGKIRRDYMNDLKDKVMATRQRATALYLIDRLALRAGNEKGDDEADTVGCCSLRYEHIELVPPNTVVFDFLGKDSIRYYNEVNVDEQVFKNLKLFKKPPKGEGDDLFDRLTTQSLNKHLSSLMPSLTAKVFRTYNASFTFQDELKKTPVDGTIAEKLLAYNRANRQVAVLCNHQRSVSKAHGAQMTRIQDKLRALKYQRRRHKQQLALMDPKLKKKRPELFEPESDLEDEWVEEYEKDMLEKEREKIKAKFEKDNQVLKENKEKPLPQSELKELLSKVDEKAKELKQEKKTGEVYAIKKNATVERLETAISKLTERILTTKTTMVDKDENKTTALGTSKINYIDPRISAAWCKKYDVPLEKIFNKSLRDKFKWAMDVDDDWEF